MKRPAAAATANGSPGGVQLDGSNNSETTKPRPNTQAAALPMEAQP